MSCRCSAFITANIIITAQYSGAPWNHMEKIPRTSRKLPILVQQMSLKKTLKCGFCAVVFPCFHRTSITQLPGPESVMLPANMHCFKHLTPKILRHFAAISRRNGLDALRFSFLLSVSQFFIAPQKIHKKLI